MDEGTWTPAPTSYAYQWYRNGKWRHGATRSTYRLTTSDRGRGRDITVKVTVKKIGCTTGTATTKKVRVS